jgi:hypothetical protein
MFCGCTRKLRAEVTVGNFCFFRRNRIDAGRAISASLPQGVAPSEAATEANIEEYFIILACELPVLVLALISFKYFKWAFWLGWAVNLLFAMFVAVIIVWLEFFWHW